MQDDGGIIRQNSGLAVDQDELLLPHGGAYSGTGEWNSRFCSVSVKFSKYSIVEVGINIIALQKRHCADRV